MGVVAASLVVNFPTASLRAQLPAVRGYITAVHPPNGFDVNGEHVITTTDTEFGPAGLRAPIKNGPMRGAVQIGARVEVFGQYNRRTWTVTAESVFFLDDADRTLTGLGVIARVISASPEVILAADGYRLHVTQATEISYSDEVRSLTDVRANLWVRYEGSLGKDGLLAASRVMFLPARPANVKGLNRLEKQGCRLHVSPLVGSSGSSNDDANLPQSPAQKAETQNGVEIPDQDPYSADYRISTDRTLQARLNMIGTNLVPDYQKQMVATDPSKIHFAFYAIDNETVRTGFCSMVGIVLVPASLAAKLQNDDQLAAVMADGMASSLQRQGAKAVEAGRVAVAAVTTGIVAAGPGGAVVGLATGNVAREIIERGLTEQRGRVALQLMAEAGYDPWQAPEAWRLAAAKKLPIDLSRLKYPERSGYQFAILNLMYKKPVSTSAAQSGSPSEDNALGKP